MKQRYIWWGLVFVGLTLILTTLMLGQIHAQDGEDEEAEYIGARECGSCHRDFGRAHEESRHVLTLQEGDEDIILADFEQEEQVPLVQFPNDDAPRPLEIDDIAYTVGSGRRVQRYLYEVDRNEYQVLPVEWNVATRQWQPFTLAENWPDTAYDWTQNCAKCHTTGLEVRRGSWEDDGVQCESCHGPGSIHAEVADDAGSSPSDRELREVRGAIHVSSDAQICGQCHSRGMDADGEHPYPTEYLPSGNLSESFTLVATDDPVHWWVSGHAKQPNMQFNEWVNSAHSQALVNIKDLSFARDECLRCHSSDYAYTAQHIAAVEEGDREGDSPDALTLETAQYGVTCSGCHSPHTENDFLLVNEDAYATCVACHNTQDLPRVHHPNQEMFEGLPFVENIEGTPSPHFTDENGPDCVTCHMPTVPVDNLTYTRETHTFQPILPEDALANEGLQDSCTTCHTEQADQAGMQRLIDEVQSSTQARLEAARAALPENSPEWVAAALDFVEGDGSLGIHNYAYTNLLLGAVEGELGLVVEESEDPQLGPAPPGTILENDAAEDESSDEATLSIQSIVIMAASVLAIALAGWVFFVKQNSATESVQKGDMK